MPVPCEQELEKWQDLYDDWDECHDEIGEYKETALQLDAAMVAACGAAVLTVETVIGGIIGAGACGIAWWQLDDALDDLNDKIKSCNKKAAKSDAQGNKYNKCVGDHKKDP